MASEIKVDTISEKTSANGVTIDGVSLKDSKIATANSVDSDAYVDGSIDTAHIDALQVTGAKLNTDVISAQTELAVAPADADEFMVSDAGVLKRIDYSLIKGGDNTPAFRAFHSATQNVSDTTLTTLSFDSETFDSDGTYDTSNGRFTPAVAGKYVLFANIRPDDENVYQFELEIRTSAEDAIAKTSVGNSAGAGDSFSVYTIADLSADEYAFVTAYHEQGGTRTMLAGTSEAFFGGFRIIGA